MEVPGFPPNKPLVNTSEQTPKSEIYSRRTNGQHQWRVNNSTCQQIARKQEHNEEEECNKVRMDVCKPRRQHPHKLYTAIDPKYPVFHHKFLWYAIPGLILPEIQA